MAPAPRGLAMPPLRRGVTSTPALQPGGLKPGFLNPRSVTVVPPPPAQPTSATTAVPRSGPRTRAQSRAAGEPTLALKVVRGQLLDLLQEDIKRANVHSMLMGKPAQHALCPEDVSYSANTNLVSLPNMWADSGAGPSTVNQFEVDRHGWVTVETNAFLVFADGRRTGPVRRLADGLHMTFNGQHTLSIKRCYVGQATDYSGLFGNQGAHALSAFVVPLCQKMYIFPNLAAGDTDTVDSIRMSTFVPRHALPVGTVYEDLPITPIGARLFFSALAQRGTIPVYASEDEEDEHILVVRAVDGRWAAWLQQQLMVPWEAGYPILPHELARSHANHPNSTYLSGLRADPAEVQAVWEAHRRLFCPPAGPLRTSTVQARLPPAPHVALSQTPTRCPRHPYAQHAAHECPLVREIPAVPSSVPPVHAAYSRYCPVHPHASRLAHECRQLPSLYPSRSARLQSACTARDSPIPVLSCHACAQMDKDRLQQLLELQMEWEQQEGPAAMAGRWDQQHLQMQVQMQLESVQAFRSLCNTAQQFMGGGGQLQLGSATGPRPRAKSLLIELEAPPPPPGVPAAGQVGRFSTRGGYARRGAPKDIQHFEPRDCHLGPGDQISPEMADKELMDNWRGRFTTDPRLFKDLPVAYTGADFNALYGEARGMPLPQGRGGPTPLALHAPYHEVFLGFLALAHGQASGALALVNGQARRVNSFPPFAYHPLMPRFPFSSLHTCIMEYGGGITPLPMPPAAMPLPTALQPTLPWHLPVQPVLQPMLQLLSLCCWCSLLFLLPAMSAFGLNLMAFLQGQLGQLGQGLISWKKAAAMHGGRGQVSNPGKAGQGRFVSCLGLRLRLAPRCRVRPYRRQLRGGPVRMWSYLPCPA